ncbi:hypothetical protein [uncultured Methanobrevibacter sp.]|uniref:hypothetical protein n=1 Tax=uncultured Methanobrevibacter sp. TaxID=253161 RepID=UPI00260775F1|nr:hypothetical protein [uncultured Methanobrevibacter sp.]
MKIKILIAILVVFTFTGCKNISKNDLRIIENIHLGGEMKDFDKQLDSLGIKKSTFYKKTFYYDLSFEKDNIRAYYLDVFDYSEYQNKSIDIHHYAMVVPEEGKYCKAVTMLLGHKGHAQFMGKIENKFFWGSISKSTGIYGFNQCIVEDIVNSIKYMLIEKYGQPNKVDSTNYYTYVITADNISYVRIPSTYKTGILYEWNTKSLNIKFFTGIISKTYSFDPLKRYNIELLIDEDKENYDSLKEKLKRGNKMVYMYPYLRYEINDKTIKKLKLSNNTL